MDKLGLEGHDYIKIKNESTDPDDKHGNHWAQNGGNQFQTTLTMSAYFGAVIENSDTRYENMQGASGIALNGLDGKYAYNNDAFVVNNVQYINKNDRDLVKKAIMNNGSAGIAYCEDFSSYNKVGDEYYFYSANSGTNHVLIIVGWDDSVPASNFINHGRTPSFDGGWLIRNSWGNSTYETDHIKDGYFWMSYEEPSIYDNVYSIDAIKADTYKYNYHYDTTGYDGYYELDAGEDSIGNIYKVTGDSDQMLQAISVVLGSTNVDFSIDVYTKNTPMDNPKDGTKVTSIPQYFTTTTAGIYTVPLDNPIELSKDTYFSIVLKLNSGAGGKVICYIDKEDLTSDPDIEYYNECNAKESFIGNNPDNWEDVSDIGDNFRIKVFTNDIIDIGFNANGGEGNMATQSIVSGTATVLDTNTFTRLGYVFDGWNTKADGSGDDYEDEDTINSTVSLTLYAKWLPIHYTVKLNPNGQTGTETTVEYAYDQEISLSNPGFTSLTYSFDGWTTDSTGSGIYYSEGQTDVKNLTTIDGDIVVLYAKWNQNVVPAPTPIRRRTGGGSSGNGSGIISKGILLPNEIPKQEDAKLLVSNVVKASLSPENVVWVYDAVHNKWSLNINKNIPTDIAINGFYTVASIDKISGQIKNNVYSFDTNGNMITGWVKDALGSLYYFNPMKNNDEGKMAVGWVEIGAGVWYNFGSDGKLLVNTANIGF